MDYINMRPKADE